MRSPRKPGYEPLVPPTPDWVGSPSADAVFLVGGAGRMSDLTISDRHFDSISSVDAVKVREYDHVVIERCTFSNIDEAINLQLSTDITIRNCAFWNINDGQTVGGHHILCDKCDTVVIEDCCFYNKTAAPGATDTIDIYLTDNVIIRRCFFMGTGNKVWNATMVLGDGPDVVNGGGDNLLAEDNVVIDGPITVIGTNCVVRRNVVLMRGLVPAQDGMAGAISTDSGSYPDNPIGPIEVSDNLCLSYDSTGTPDRFPINAWPPNSNGNTGVASNQTGITGIASNPVNPLIDEYSRWNISGYYGAP